MSVKLGRLLFVLIWDSFCFAVRVFHLGYSVARNGSMRRQTDCGCRLCKCRDQVQHGEQVTVTEQRLLCNRTSWGTVTITCCAFSRSPECTFQIKMCGTGLKPFGVGCVLLTSQTRLLYSIQRQGDLNREEDSVHEQRVHTRTHAINGIQVNGGYAVYARLDHHP